MVLTLFDIENVRPLNSRSLPSKKYTNGWRANDTDMPNTVDKLWYFYSSCMSSSICTCYTISVRLNARLLLLTTAVIAAIDDYSRH